MELLCLAFVNSQWYQTHQLYREPLRDDQWFAEFLNSWDLTIEEEITGEQINQLIGLRSQLLALMKKVSLEQAFSEKEIERLNMYLALSDIKPQLKYQNERFTLEFSPQIRDFNWLLTQIVTSFTQLLTGYDLRRLKICQNVECQWIFIDESKNRTRRWCDQTCGNLMKVRRFRAKQKNKRE